MRAARVTPVANVARESCGWRPIARREEAGRPPDGMTAERSGSNQQVVPRPRSSAGRAGRFDSQRQDDDERHDRSARSGPTRAGQGLRSGRGRGRDLRALARRGRLRPGRCRIPGGPVEAAVRHRPAAAERDRRPAHRPRAHGGHRGRDDPPRPDAGSADALAAGTGPRLDRRPGRARPDPGRRGRGPRSRSGASATSPRMWAFVDETRDTILGQSRRLRLVARLGPDPVHDGRGQLEGRPDRLHPALPRRAGLPDRGPRQLVPGLPDERQRSRGGPDAGGRHALDAPLPPARRRRSGGSGALDPDRHDPPRDPPRRRRGGRPSRGPALRRLDRPDRRHPVRRPAGPGHRRRGRRARLRDRGGQDHPGPRRRRSRHRPAPRPADRSPSSTTTPG